jgi:hypothetical protein
MYYPIFYLLYQIKACLADFLHCWARRLCAITDNANPFLTPTRRGYGCSTSPKPPWVREALLRVKAQMPEASSRFLAATFNRRFRLARRMTVGKTYVAKMLKQHTYEIQNLSAELKRWPPFSFHCTISGAWT